MDNFISRLPLKVLISSGMISKIQANYKLLKQNWIILVGYATLECRNEFIIL